MSLLDLFSIPAFIMIAAFGFFCKWLWVVEVPHEHLALVKRFGRYHRTLDKTGWHLILWPVESLHWVDWMIPSAAPSEEGTRVKSKVKFIPKSNRFVKSMQLSTSDNVTLLVTFTVTFHILEAEVAVLVFATEQELIRALEGAALQSLAAVECAKVSTWRMQAGGEIASKMIKHFSKTFAECFALHGVWVIDVSFPAGFIETQNKLQLLKAETAEREKERLSKVKSIESTISEVEEHHKVALARLVKRVELERNYVLETTRTFIDQRALLAQARVPQDVIDMYCRAPLDLVLGKVASPAPKSVSSDPPASVAAPST